MSGEVIGAYKIEDDFLPGRCLVRKALGPWPLRNWSWISYYDGTAEQCRQYIRWAERVDAGDKALVKHASNWLHDQVRRPDDTREDEWTCKCVEHLPKTWRYDFTNALALHPNPPEAETSTELLLVVIVIVAAVIGAVLYNSV